MGSDKKKDAGHGAKEQTQKQQDAKSGTPTNQISGLSGDMFAPQNVNQAPHIDSGLSPETWSLIQIAPANFLPQYFLDVSRNLVENPNLTAPQIARAELSYQSFTDATYNPAAKRADELARIVKHLRPEYRPTLLEGGIDGYALEWTVVRKLIPRNPNLDKALMQTCHFYTSHEAIDVSTADGCQKHVNAVRHMLVFIPHAASPDEIPFYHPKIQKLAIMYIYFSDFDKTTSSTLSAPGQLSIYFNLFPSHPLDDRLSRTALSLLNVTHKHARGRQAGYTKRVHHDQIIPQKAFGDTYAYLKSKYAKGLIDGWIEQTPAEKHVFEDLGIAAFLIELWTDMYGTQPTHTSSDDDTTQQDHRRTTALDTFPGFVDIGCGNGVLVYILVSEGWPGWGFDARRRQTWDKLPFPSPSPSISDPPQNTYLHELLLLPCVLQPTIPDPSNVGAISPSPPSHPGLFPPHTFLIANHADHLTPWTPLLAFLSHSPFLLLPCCSHSLSGSRFRAPAHKPWFTNDHPCTTLIKGKQPSAFASLCSWTAYLAGEVGYEVEKEHLRIPSTKNTAIVGRRWKEGKEDVWEKDTDIERWGVKERMAFVRELVAREMGGKMTVEVVGKVWMDNGVKLMKDSTGFDD